MIRIIDGLYLGDHLSAQDLRRLRQEGVTHIVNCTDDLPNYHAEHFVYLCLGLADPDPGLHLHIARACAFIDDARKSGGVLVHCFAAHSRSPSVVLSYLCHLGASLEEAAEKLGEIVWTDPDYLFLEQIAGHTGCVWDAEAGVRLSYLLKGRKDPPWVRRDPPASGPA